MLNTFKATPFFIESHRAAAARSYAARRWPVIPLCWPRIRPSKPIICSCGKENCRSAGKHPIASLAPHGLDDGTVDAETIGGWWGRFASANIGIVTGRRSGIIVVDVDPRNGGDKSLAEHIDSYGELPSTTIADTGGGGTHYVFQRPDVPIVQGKDKLGPGLDVKGDGGYIVAPPSLHESGDHYGWRVEPDDQPPAPAPKWMLAILAPPKPRIIAPQVINRDARDNAAERCIRYLSKCNDAISGQGGHDATLRAACECYRFGLSDVEAQRVMAWWNTSKCQPPWSEREIAHKLMSGKAKVNGAGEFGIRLHERRSGKGRFQ